MNIYVGNLSYKVSDQELQEMFVEFGEVTSAKVIKDRETGRSKGFGFVEMTSDEDAQAAIDELDGAEIDGRTLKVNKARPKESAGNRSRQPYNRR
ncbi:MAG: RNA-binding protein [Fodinibius sp.]|nr:RNA-binding protein [Fodinibius sp.]